MPAFMKAIAPHTHALLRIVAGFMFMWHGMQKLFGIPLAAPDAPAFILYVAGPIELIGGALIMLGFMTGWAAFVCSGTMAVAYLMDHQPQALLPIQNKGELAALYCFVFFYLSAHGSGIWSVDAVRKGG